MMWLNGRGKWLNALRTFTSVVLIERHDLCIFRFIYWMHATFCYSFSHFVHAGVRDVCGDSDRGRRICVENENHMNSKVELLKFVRNTHPRHRFFAWQLFALGLSIRSHGRQCRCLVLHFAQCDCIFLLCSVVEMKGERATFGLSAPTHTHTHACARTHSFVYLRARTFIQWGSLRYLYGN